ncbi:hypothetical protein [Sphingomonas bacterium]|uniref:hypothetical protein n=1 Tax=Sphingomonas bacterium TaxID=1895847 RepID=UPI0015762B32|nr:hypothetical protein [Sphingomonas bacterium]
MTPLDRFAADLAKLARSAARLKTLERRHRVLETGFARLEKEAAREHFLGRAAPAYIGRLARLDRWMTRGEAEALALIGIVVPLLATGPARG